MRARHGMGVASAGACLLALVSSTQGCSAGSDDGAGGAANGSSVGASGGAGGHGGLGNLGGSGGLGVGGSGLQGGGGHCAPPPNPAGPEVALAAEYAPFYSVYALGAVPGVPDPLGGCVVLHDDPNTLLIAGASERAEGQIYAIEVERDACGHIVGFVGSAVPVAQTPYVDANLIYGPNNLLIYTQWPQFKISQLPDGAVQSALDTDLVPLGVPTSGDQGPGGIGFVPPSLDAAGQLRIVTWPAGHWFHVTAALGGSDLYDITGLSEAGLLSNGPGGFAYVPAGSAGFPNQSLIVAEWSPGGPDQDRVTTYEVDAQGDPIVATRKEFFTKFPRPWGAYFEPVTGDYLFLTWGAAPPDRVYIVQGFVPPPPPPPPR